MFILLLKKKKKVKFSSVRPVKFFNASAVSLFSWTCVHMEKSKNVVYIYIILYRLACLFIPPPYI